MSAENAGMPALPIAPPAEATPEASAPRGRLFRKYVLIFVGLVAVALLVNSGFDFWFGYQENKAALVRIQQEKADAAAQRIAEFVEEIERQIGWTTHAEWSAAPLDQRRFDYVRLLSQVPAITEISELDKEGKEQLKVSRLAMDVVGSNQDFSKSPAFTEAKAHKLWFSPVYFRKESEPYMTLAMARAGRNAGVTVAEVNLKLIWDVITTLKIGQGGYAYVVDQRGKLIAHPDISLVLRDTDFLHLPQVSAALHQAPGAPTGLDVTVARNNAGVSVLSAHATIPQLDWLVFVEVPLQEAYAPLYGAALRGTVLLLLGLLGATLAALVLARRMTGPIRQLQEGAARIGGGALDRRIEIHTGDELEGLANQFNRMAADLETSYAELEHRVEARTAELAEALDQQTATAEVLGVINSSPGDLAPVFDAMLEKALTLCEAGLGLLLTYDGKQYRAAAIRGAPAAYVEFMMRAPIEAGPTTGLARLARDRAVVHIADLADDDAYRERDPLRVASVELANMRTFLAVPLVKDSELLGAFVIYRQEVRPFTEKQIALLENFAAQAVIAIENTRLIAETQEALDQQTATAEVLGVINASPGDLGPVFDAMLDKARALCGADLGALFRYDGTKMNLAAMHGLPLSDAGFFTSWVPGAGDAMHDIIHGKSLIHIPDIVDTDAYRAGVESRVRMAEVTGARSALWVSLRKDETLLGVIVAYRSEVRPFSDKQIALIQNFAAQAVIAIENARLITETQEALDQQTATAEVLQVINSSPGNLTPVFDAMLERAVRLCEADAGHLFRFENGAFFRLASRGVSEDFDELFPPDTPVPMNPGSVPARMIATRSVVHVHDAREDESFTVHRTRDEVAAVEAGILTVLFVPLIKEGEVVGHFTMHRMEVKPFSEKQIALVQNFAAQAVIAMDNARLITETQEALDQQTATAEVLGVINASPGDLAPVFDAMLEKAMRLCEATIGTLWTFDDDGMRAAAIRGAPPEYAEFLKQGPLPPNAVQQRFVHGEPVVQIADLAASEMYRSGYPLARAAVDLGGVQTLLVVSLRKDDASLGQFSIYRKEVRPFTDKQIALLQNFAAQAVIAIENARLITETQEALDQQTATAEVLQVINANPGDLQPVFDVILEKAMALCDVAYGDLELYDGETFRAVATRGLTDAFAEQVRRGYPAGDNPATRPLVAGARVSHIVNMAEADFSKVFARAPAEDEGHQTLLCVPLRRENALLGMIACARREVRAFSEKEITLLESFAAQAVIAIENARLLGEIRQRQAELRVTFDNMGDGVVMFDGELRLAAWNKNFQELLDLPDEILEERTTYSEYLHILGERGEFGPGDVEEELSRRLAHADEELRYERTRPNGQILEVRRNSVAGGGFVLIYSDITERKRSEEEIRAARDAAEKTLGELKTAQASLIQAEKMASLGQLTAGIAHEIKNPLNFVNNFAHLSIELLDELKEIAGPALDTLDADKRADLNDTMEMLTGNLDKIGEHGRRADNIVKSMLEHSRGVTGERREIDLNALLEESLNLAYHGARAQDQTFNITLERDFDAAMKPIEVAPQDITRVFLNLFGNGFYAASKRARANGQAGFRPVLRVATHDDGAAVVIKVRDNGTGIPANIRDKLFQPFFTTKPTGEGTGLGLSISYDIVTQQHGGTIAVDSEEGSFTEFTIRLPRSGQASPAARR